MSNRTLISLVVSFTSLTALSGVALANRPFPARYDNATNCVSAVGGGAALVPGGQLVAAGCIGWQIGWYLGRTIIDPPDPANAGNPVNLGSVLAGHQYQSFSTLFPGADAQLANLMDQSMQKTDLAVALARATNMSLDRYSGALQISNPAYAVARLAEAHGFLSQLKATANEWAAMMPSIVNRIDVVAPGLLDNRITTAMAQQWRDAAAAGLLPILEPQAWNVYQPTAPEHADIMSRAAALTNADIDLKFGGNSDLTYRMSLLNAASEISSVMQTTEIVPSPAGSVVLGLAGLGMCARRRRAA